MAAAGAPACHTMSRNAPFPLLLLLPPLLFKDEVGDRGAAGTGGTSLPPAKGRRCNAPTSDWARRLGLDEEEGGEDEVDLVEGEDGACGTCAG